MRSYSIGTTIVGLVLVSIVAASTASGQSVLYVDDDAPAGGDGLTWATAHKYLQDALTAAAGSGGTVTEVRVAKGTYKPDQGAGRTPGDRKATFQLLSAASQSEAVTPDLVPPTPMPATSRPTRPSSTVTCSATTAPISRTTRITRCML